MKNSVYIKFKLKSYDLPRLWSFDVLNNMSIHSNYDNIFHKN